jgi:uncharacterized membrane protein required for colicin V production
MHLADIIFLVLAAVFIGIGIWRGLVSEAARLLAVVIGFAVASAFYRSLAAWLSFLPGSLAAYTIASFILIFVAAALATLAAGWVVKKVVHLTVLGWVDGLCGGVIGLVKAFIVAWVACLIVAALPAPGVHAFFSGSVTYGVCRKLPLQLRLPGVKAAERSIENIMAEKPISELPRRFQQFRSTVDSVRNDTRK